MPDCIPRVHYFVHKRCTPQWELLPQEIAFYDLTFILEGRAVYYSQNGAHILEAGQAVFLPKGSFRCAQTAGMECAAFNFQLEGALPWAAGPLDFEKDELILHRLAEFERAWNSLDENKAMRCMGLFLLILHRMLALTGPKKSSPHVAEVRRYLEEHYLERVTVASVAAHIGLHPTYCGALFKQETGRTILQTVNLLRINRAASLLEYGGARVTDVALECGFSDLYYFSRVFKQFTGRSPEQFLRESGGQDGATS